MDPVDLLVFGPHPDDLEIGAGGTVAKHAAMGLRVGLVDLTQGEMGSNGTVDQRLAEAEEARKVLGAAWRTNLHWPDRAIGSSGDHVVIATELIRRVRPKAIALPYWSDRHPDHIAASNVLTNAIEASGADSVSVRRTREEGRLRVSIENPGTLDQDPEKLFSPRCARAGRPWGMGLAQARLSAAAAGGTVRLEQRSDRITAILELPEETP